MSDTQKSENCISGFSILRATMMAVLFPAVLVYYYDAVFWKPYFYGPWNTPTLWSFLAMAAGGLAAAVHRFLRRRKGRPLPRPGIEEIWLTLAAGALSAHSMAKTPGLLNIRYTMMHIRIAPMGDRMARAENASSVIHPSMMTVPEICT